MFKWAASVLTMCFIFIQANAQEDSILSNLEKRISDSLSSQKGIFALAFKDLATGKKILINEHEIYHAASTMKTPVLIELYKQASLGKFSLRDSLILKNEFRSIADSSLYSLSPTDDSDSTLYQHLGEKRAIRQLCYLMITMSSNFSTNLLIDLVGAKNVTASLRKMGINEIQVLRGVEDNKAFDQGMNNTVTAYGLMQLFTLIAEGKAVSKGASAEMIKILLDQHFNEVIPAKLPSGVKVAHKTGSFKTVHHDSGIVFLQDGRKYVLVILSKNLEDEDSSVRMMANVSEIIYQYMTSN